MKQEKIEQAIQKKYPAPDDFPTVRHEAYLQQEAARWAFRRAKVVLTAELLAVVNAAEELNEILSDHEARSQIDSFTGQPLRIALAAYKEGSDRWLLKRSLG